MKKSTLEAADLMLSELLDLEADVKEKNKQIAQIRIWCKSQGSFTTDKYVCAVVTRSRTALAPLDEVREVVSLELLEGFGLVRKTEYQTVVISQKAASLKSRFNDTP